MTDAKIDAMRRAANIMRGIALAFDEAPHERVSRGEVAKTLNDVADELIRQADMEEPQPIVIPASD